MKTLANRTAERTVLGAMLLDARAVVEQLPTLTESMFYWSEHGALYGLMVSMLQADIPVDLLSVMDRVKDDQRTYGPLADVGTLSDDIPTTHVRHWAVQIQELDQSRKLQAIISDAQSALESGVGAAEVLGLIDSADFSVGEAGGFESMRDIAPGVAERSMARREQSLAGRQVYLPLPTQSLQNALMIPVGEAYLGIVAGRPGHGKTSVALQALKCVAESQVWDSTLNAWRPGRGLMVSLEMQKDPLTKRLATQHTGVNYVNVDNGMADDAAARRFYSGLADVSELRISIDDRSGRTPEEVCRAIRRDVRINGPVDLVVIDYLGKLAIKAAVGDNMPAAIGAACGLIRDTMKKIGACCFLLSQVNRAVDNRPNRVPGMGDLSGSSGIENEADLIMFTFRDEAYNGKMSDRVGIMDLSFGKNRAGRMQAIAHGWEGQYMRIYDLEEGHRFYAEVTT